jgi:hypothetical protein
MCNPFFYKFRVILSANLFQLVCCIANLFTTEAVDERVDRNRHLSHLGRRRASGGHDLFCDGSLQERAAWAGAAELRVNVMQVPIQAAGK